MEGLKDDHSALQDQSLIRKFGQTYGSGLNSVAPLLMIFFLTDTHECSRDWTASVAEFLCLKLFYTSVVTDSPRYTGP